MQGGARAAWARGLAGGGGDGDGGGDGGAGASLDGAQEEGAPLAPVSGCVMKVLCDDWSMRMMLLAPRSRSLQRGAARGGSGGAWRRGHHCTPRHAGHSRGARTAG